MVKKSFPREQFSLENESRNKLTPVIKKVKFVAYSSQGSHTGQLDFCNWLADGSTTG